MNKLISRNPVQRFKQGRKIEKFQGGGFSRKESGRTSNEQALYLLKKIFNPRKWFYVKTTGGGLIGKINNGSQENNNQTSQQTSFKTPELKGSREAYLKRLEQQGFTAKPTKDISNESSKSKKPITVNNYYVKGFENRKNELTKQGKTVRDIQKMLGFTGKDLDGKWGKNTEAAYLKYLNKQTPELPTSQQLVEHVQNQMKPVETNIQPSVYQQMSQLTNGFTQTPTLSKTTSTTTIQMPSQYEDMLRGKYKIGGQLPSRNIVKRFKQGGIQKFQTAGNLPTAPKAEKRYRKSSYNTTKKGNRETTTITSQTFGYNRNWPYFRQPATIQRIIEGKDTAFVETPEHHIFAKVQPRTALKSGNAYFEYNPKYDENFSLGGQANTLANYPVTPQEYEILKRRFNAAWNQAK